MSAPLPSPPADQLAAWLAATALDYLELRGPGFELCLLKRDGRVEMAPPGYQPRLAVSALAITAPSVGRVRLAHPMRTGPLVESGQAVVAGQTLMLLEIGALLLPVVAPNSGSVLALHARDGDLVGYGAPLVDLVPASADKNHNRPTESD